MTLPLSPDKARGWAQQEAALGIISIDENGMSHGMTVNVMQPIRSVLSEWRQCRDEFDAAIQPKMASISAVDQAQADLEEAERRREADLASVEKKLETNADYIKKRELKETSYTRWKGLQDIHSGRAAIMFGYSWLYLLLIACIGVAEWFINYDVLLQFTGVPAIAAGRTSYSAHSSPSRLTDTASYSSNGAIGSARAGSPLIVRETGAFSACPRRHCLWSSLRLAAPATQLRCKILTTQGTTA